MFDSIIKYIRGEISSYSSSGRTFIFLSALIFFLTRVLGDSILVIFNKFDSGSMIIWKTITTFSIFAAVTTFLFNDIWKKRDLGTEFSGQKFTSDIFQVVIVTILLLLMSAFLPGRLSTNVMSNNILILMYADLTAFVGVFAGLYVYYFLYKWLMAKSHKRTNLYLSILTISLAGISFAKFITYLFYVPLLEYIDSIIDLLYILLAIFLFSTIKRLHWLALLPRKEKFNVLGLSSLGIIVSIFAYNNAMDTGEGLGRALFLFLPESQIFLVLTYIMSSVYLARIFLAVLISLPTTSIVEKSVYESKSLMYLSKVIAQTVDFDNLVSTVTRLALSASGAMAVMTEIKDDGKEARFSLSSSQKITQDILNQLQHDEAFGRFLLYTPGPILIETLDKYDSDIIDNAELKKSIRSLIVIPLYTGGERIGNIVAIHTEDYGFEEGEMKVLEAFSDNINIALDNARLLKDSIEKENLKRELMLARVIQQKLLPVELPAIHNFSIGAFTTSAEEVGGDYYDIVRIKNSRYCLLIGDVSGKGMSAAFYMAQLKGVVQAVSRESEGAADILKKINNTLYGNMEKQMYITLSALVVENESGVISIARAGHMPAVVKKNGKVDLLASPGIGIGLCESTMFDNVIVEETIQMDIYDKCILYTDGISELRNHNNEELGTEFLKQIAGSQVYTNAGMIIENISEKINRHSANSLPHDDMTIVAVVYEGKKN